MFDKCKPDVYVLLLCILVHSMYFGRQNLMRSMLINFDYSKEHIQKVNRNR